MTQHLKANTFYKSMITVLSISWFLGITVATLVAAWCVFRALLPRLALTSTGTRCILALSSIAFTILLLRPHQDTFTGLDTSCYRLMTQAFNQGRGFHDIDRTLLEIPFQHRRTALLEYEKWGRDTRDRSFEIPSLKTGITQPYFYPTLPLAAAGLETVSRVVSADYFVPLVGIVLGLLLLCTGAALGGTPGILSTLVLLFGTPLPTYLFRGFYAEAVGAALVCIVLLGRVSPVRTTSYRRTAPLLLGLAVCFHPVTLAIALPTLALLLFDCTLSRKNIATGIIGFVVGLLPLLAMTIWICQPYGNIISWAGIWNALAGEAVHRLLAAFVIVFAAAAGSAFLASNMRKATIITAFTRFLDKSWGYPVLLATTLLPLVISATLWSGKPLIQSGMREYWDGVRVGYGIVLAIGLCASFRRNAPLIGRIILALAALLAPLFFYLKGFEQMGLWSQRRLIPLSLLLIVALTPLLADALRALISRRGAGPTLLVGAVLLCAGLANPVRWPSPYYERHEKGADRWVDNFTTKLANRLTFFDYYPYSVPFTASGRNRVIGLSQYGYDGLPGLAEWLAGKATEEQVLWVTAFTNPGLEAGVILKEISHETASFNRLASKTSLPAEIRPKLVDVRILEPHPIAPGHTATLHKTFDDGPLALRGPWGRRSNIRTSGAVLEARWSRQGSGVVGPIPPPGQGVKITLIGDSARDDGIQGQRLLIRAPWGGPELSLLVGDTLTTVSGVLSRKADDPSGTATTGIYQIHAEKPYNPGKAGIKGYPTDLGARCHSIIIEPVISD